MISILAEQCHLLFQPHQLLIVIPTVDPSKGKIVYSDGVWKSLQGEEIPLMEWMRRGESVLLQREKLENDPKDFFTAIIDRISENESIEWFPMKTQLADVGWLCLSRQVPLSSHERHILHAVLDIAASAFQRASLYSQTIQRLKQLNALHIIDRAINASLDLNFTTNVLLAQVVQHLEVNAATLLKFNALSQMISVLATYQYPKHLIPLIYQLTDDPLCQTILERKIVVIEDLRSYRGNRPFWERSIGQGYVGYAAVPLISKGQVKGILELFKYRELQFSPEQHRFLEALAEQAVIAIDNSEMFETLQRRQTHLSLAYEGVIEGFARALELRDPELYGHSKRVAEITVRLARQFGFGEQELTYIRHGALLHDIGNLAIPETILQKPGPLSDEEWAIVRKHPEYAMDILSSIPSLQPAAVIPYCHHEHWD
ncbi:MAG: GAF domain-containing protein, partial [Anaerolineales bacterium]|nr:GAF domain-containing protein [Anaerolineales bacterium]